MSMKKVGQFQAIRNILSFNLKIVLLSSNIMIADST